MIKQYIRRYFFNRFRTNALVLMYHRINKPGMDPWGICVSPEFFEEQLQILKQYTNPLSIQELIEDYKNKSLKKYSVVITFDDGYADNLYIAKPLLEKYSIPAVFYISAGHIDSKREFWWDELERLLLKPVDLPDELCLNMNGKTEKIILGRASRYSQEEYEFDCVTPMLKNTGSRFSFFDLVWKKIYSLNRVEKENILSQLAEWSGQNLTPRETHRVLTYQELQSLGNNSLFEIGAHGVNHSVFTKITKTVQKDEITGSKNFLYKALNKEIKSFAFPHGEYTSDSKKIVELAGYSSACTTDGTSFGEDNDLFAIPRFQVLNWNGDLFHKKIKTFFRH